MFYVYTHSIDDVVFYVGCSTAKETVTAKTYGVQHLRAREISKRSKYWKSFVSGRIVRVEIVFYSENIEEIYAKEKDLISFYGRVNNGTGTLVNQGNGGRENDGLIFDRKVFIVQMKLDGSEIRVWDSPLSIENELGFLRTNIIKCCRKKQLTANGFKWRYLIEGALENIKPMASLKMRTNKFRPDLQAIGKYY